MSKLPIVSGAECIKALEKIGFSVYRQRGSHITMVCQEPANQVTSNYPTSWVNCR